MSVAAIESSRTPPASGGQAPAPFFRSVLLLRSLLCLALLATFHEIVPLGTPLPVVAAAAIAAMVLTSHLALSRLNFLGFIAVVAATWGLGYGITTLGALYPSSRYFASDIVELHGTTCLIFASIAALSTWIFWRSRWGIGAELLFFAVSLVGLFAGHRQFNLDRPKLIGSVAWRLGVDPLVVFVGIGALVVAGAIGYLSVASRAVRPRVDRLTVQGVSGVRQWGIGALALLLLVGVVYTVEQVLYEYFFAQVQARQGNGVGMGGSEAGVSPLSFQSALGSTNQPAALLRLEGDYSGNPFSPMMYLRESALSTFNGHEMVDAGQAYDTDVPTVSPVESFTGKEDDELAERTPVTQSVYLLADHKRAFALDYPLSLVQLKNPKPDRFKATYRATSVAPTFPPREIDSREVGDPRWTAEVRAHYLEPHTDPRYKELAEKLTAGIDDPVEKIRALTTYLSKTAIYTLTPNHQIEPSEDPVAPFLFGDNRGYCVHFAHAMVYMLRALGIPARIGTGYLTDLSQAKDGHILLRMSDRHAWSEAFITGIGWVPFDIQPEHVESHADTQVDAKLLEELMGMLEPGEEILPSELTKNEPGMNEPMELWLPDTKDLQLLGYVVVALAALMKLSLWCGWRIMPTPHARLRWGRAAISARLADIGYIREYGETQHEFFSRCPYSALSRLDTLVAAERYAPGRSGQLQRSDVTTALAAVEAAIHSPLPVWRRLIAALNPVSLARALGGRLW